LGPLSISIPGVFSDLNIDVVTINAHRTSIINKEGEIFPNPHSIRRVSYAVNAVNADLGIIIDVEGVKVLFVDDKGVFYCPEDTAAFLIYHSLKKRNGNIILSKLFTRRFDEALIGLGAKIIRTPDSPGNIGRFITSERAVTGATDNGKIFNPIWGAETDGTLSALTLLSILAINRKPLSNLMEEFENKKTKYETVSRMDTTIQLPSNLTQLSFFRAVRQMQHYNIRDSLIGIKLDLEGGSVGHYLTSLKENEIKILVESTNSAQIAQLLDTCVELAKRVIQTSIK
jgi:phosphomannomutase